jgi:GNAT superfamily N-acetyltransferase
VDHEVEEGLTAMNLDLSQIHVTLTEDVRDPRYGVLRGDDGQGSRITGEVATGPLIAHRFKDPLGVAVARQELLRSLQGPTAWLFRIEVPVPLRGAGRGVALFAASLELLRKRGVRYVALVPRPESYERLEGLLRFYKRFGFERRGDYLVLDFDRIPR